ncbi:DUF3514 domain-containing protein [Ehrlichia canis]|uniref:Uncharacterized protein n=1 Tax=Ehrlichia canis (strain Jake) TaxID=269484 RepID=A0ACA6AV83_EHRCJ|nr:DUF3514 domain-containing protein [Ehrlichia canis]AAZ68115.1 hypothetical protein Ecaj_0064 [Ehrlichia canis str. Jake]
MLNKILKKFLVHVEKSQLNESIINFYFCHLLSEDDNAVYSGRFYKRVLSTLCQLVRLRLCDPDCVEQHDVLNLGIVSCAMIMGTMYKQYISLQHFSGDVKGYPSFSQVVTCMGPQRHHRGVFAQLCVTILCKICGLNNLQYNEAVLFNGLYMPGGLITNASEHFLGKITQCINNNEMFFGVVIEDLATQVCMMLDRMHLAAVKEEIEAYCAAYDKIMHSSSGQGPSR